MKKMGVILISIILLSTLRVPSSQGFSLDMQENGGSALIGLFMLLAFTGTNSTVIYETPDTMVSYTYLNVSEVEPMFVITTVYLNVSAIFDFYLIKRGVTTRFATIGVNMTSIWVEYPTSDLSSWNYYEFNFSDELQTSEKTGE